MLSAELIVPTSMNEKVQRRNGILEVNDTRFADTPWQADQEWANALTHAIAAVGTIGLAFPLLAASNSFGMAVACAAYLASVLGTFSCSTLSHLVRPSDLLNRLRAWDQAFIYTMISGTYTPIIYRFASDSVRPWLLTAIWLATAAGFLGKVALQHRVNSVSAVTYLLLGWTPAVLLSYRVPGTVISWVLVGGVLYTTGLFFLINDRKVRYFHVLWHLFVMLAAFSHYWTIYQHVVADA